VYEAFRRVVHNAGVPTIRFHDLRHTHGSLLIEDGIPVKVVSERLGHVNAFTMQNHQHLLPDMPECAAFALPHLRSGEPARTVIDRQASADDTRGDSRRRNEISSGTGGSNLERTVDGLSGSRSVSVEEVVSDPVEVGVDALGCVDHHLRLW
jgi:hypothetical protein